MEKTLYDFVSSVRLITSPDEEKFLVSNEKAKIRSFLRNVNKDYLPSVISKIVFINMLGYDTSWAQTATINLMSSERFSHKCIGYIGSCVLLEAGNDLEMLTTQIVTKDASSEDDNVKYLALSYVANFGSKEVCRSLVPVVKKHIRGGSPRIMKAAAMALTRIVRTNPDLADSCSNDVQPLLNSSSHGVVNAGICLVITLIQNEPKMSSVWKQFVGPFTKILKGLFSSRPVREFKYETFNDPFMQIRCLKVLSLLSKGSDELDTLLQNLISNIITKKNIGRTILYQAVETILGVSQNTSLRALAFNQVGRLLTMSNPCILYSSLSTFARILSNEKIVCQKGSMDMASIQRYKTQIAKCLEHKDPSIRRRALDVITDLIDENNAETLIPEILVYVKIADSDFKTDFVSRIYYATQKYATSKKWNFDIVHQLLIESGNYVSNEIISSFCDLITNSPEIQLYAVEKLRNSLVNFSENQSLVQVASFIIGEFSNQNKGEIESFTKILDMPQTKSETIMYIVFAIAKLATRFQCYEQAKPIFEKFSKSNNIEVQQRSGEIMKLLSHNNICEEILSPISETATIQEQNPIKIIEENNNSNVNQKQDDILLSILNENNDIQPTNSSTQVDDDDLLSLALSLPSTNNTNNTQLVTPPNQVTQTSPPPNDRPVLMKTNELTVYGQIRVNPQDPRQIALQLIYYSNSSMLTDFQASYQVNPGWKINIQKPDGNQVFPFGGKALTQVLYLLKETNIDVQIRTNLSFKFGSQPITETGIIKSLSF